jgi:hypothetical protein
MMSRLPNSPSRDPRATCPPAYVSGSCSPVTMIVSSNDPSSAARAGGVNVTMENAADSPKAIRRFVCIPNDKSTDKERDE